MKPVAALSMVALLLSSPAALPAAESLLIEKDAGPVTEGELRAFKRFMRESPIPTKNLRNAMVYGSGGAAVEAMGRMVELCEFAPELWPIFRDANRTRIKTSPDMAAILLAQRRRATSSSKPEWPRPLPFEYTEGQMEPRSEVRDPCIVREGDTYYLVFTMWPFRNREESRLSEPNQGGSPGIALYASQDLKTWSFTNWIVKASDLPENGPFKHRFWAPERHKIAGKFCLIFTADNWLRKEWNPAGTWGSAGYAYVGVADRITGPYEHITWIRGAGCDTTLCSDTNGKTYAIIPRGDMDVQEIDLGAMRLVGEPKRMVTADNSDIGIAARPDYLEGPWVEKIGAKYCLFYAAIHTDRKFSDWLGYWTGVATADHPLGPWTKDPRGRIFLGGHLAVFDGPDNRKWFSYRGENRDAAHGKLCVAPVNGEQQ